MEAQEEIKKKQPEPSSPLPLMMATSSCTTEGSNDVSLDHTDHVFVSSSSSGNLTQSVQDETEEEDTAKCLILLALDHKRKSGVDVYECKTCSRCFASFQALGGHRTGHTKVKLTTQVKHEHVQLNEESTKLTLQISGNPNKNNMVTGRIHECSICGAKFNSGQALGGHMRRHRPIPMVQQNQAKKPKTLLLLDLNLPPPEHDHQYAAAKQQVIVFSSSPLVDYHY